MGVGCGLPAWIGEAEQRGGGSPVLQIRSEGVNLEKKAETGEMWLLVRGGRGEVDISVEAENLESPQQKNGAQSVIRHGPLFRHGLKIFCAASHMVGYNKLCGIYLIFRLDLNYIMGSQ